MDNTKLLLDPEQVEQGATNNALKPDQASTSPASQDAVSDEVDLEDFLLDEANPDLKLLHNLIVMC